MEFLNKIELQGVIGNVQLTPVSGTKVARFSLATNYAYTGNDGGAIIDTTWFSVSAWEGDKISCLDNLQKGTKVHVIGRVRCQRYIDASGCDRQCREVVASELKIEED